MKLLLVVRPHHPTQFVIIGFAVAVLVVAGLLQLPVAREVGVPASFREALFTATSAVCVTGLTVVDTPTHWSTFGEVVILAGIQAGGFGFMTAASLLGLLVSRRIGLRTRLLASAESKAVDLGDAARVLRGVAKTTLLIEALVAVVVGLRLWLGYDQAPGHAAYLGVFHAVSAFNNAGFALYSDNLIGFLGDPWVLLPVAAAVVLGGIGFPVLFELRRELRLPRAWSLHTKITLLGSGVLLASGTGFFLITEWANPATLGPLDAAHKLIAGFVQGGVMPRTAGFNAIDYAAAKDTTLLVTDGLMFIGGGSAGTAGGIKVSTFFLLFFAILAEARGDPHVEVFRRELPGPVLRQALTVALLGVAFVIAGALALLEVSDITLDKALFETTSAFATVGLSAGVTPGLPPSGDYVLIALMFIGRTGSVTLASALALRERPRLYRLPKERALVG